MSKKFVLVLGLGLVGLAGCTQNIQPTDLDRGLIGAGVGATIASVGGHNVARGAAIGAVAGALCDDVKLCEPNRQQQQYQYRQQQYRGY